MSQTDDILRHLQTKGSISNLEAQGLYKCRALPRRIADLKDRGYRIEGMWKTDNTGQRYKRYFYYGKTSRKSPPLMGRYFKQSTAMRGLI